MPESKHARLLFALIMACVLVSAALQSVMPSLRYVYEWIPLQPWRMLTAHWVHVGWRHYALNMLAFLFLPVVFPNFSIRALFACLVLLSLFISSCFYLFMPSLQAYVGLSGVLHGMYALAALQALQQPRERQFAMLVLGLIGLKLLWEKLFGSESEVLIQAPVVIEAHQFGVLGGIVFAVICYTWCQPKRTSY